ncbi:MAG: hypothetical protein KatS3mg081_2597 [Gemmatimonadales bacterium]|nr:MAG: hypothetical protein KatS3mg081_2597 [Gemmatimonadales bacterium]
MTALRRFLPLFVCLLSLVGVVRDLAARQEGTPPQETFQARLERAIAAMDSAEIERAVVLLRELLISADPLTPRPAVARAHLHLAAASLSIGLRDSALAHLREMVRANPFAVPDTLVFNPDLVAYFRTVRRTTPALDIRVTRDTVLTPGRDTYLVAVAVGEPRQVSVVLTAEGGAAMPEVRRQVDSSTSFSLPLVGPDSLPLPAGSYRLSVAAGTDLEITTSIRLTQMVAMVDTVPHQPPPDSSLFRPETRKGRPADWSALAGTMLGAAAFAVPITLSNPDLRESALDVGGISIGASIAIAGVAGIFVGRKPIPIPENIRYNAGLIAAWEQRNREIAAENQRRRQWAPIRIEVIQP